MRFMQLPTLLINVDRSPERRLDSAQALHHLGLSWERVPGVDGAQLPELMIQQLNPPCRWAEWFRPLTPGEIGCFLSHVRCWKTIVDRQWPCALILEDDFAPEVSTTADHLSSLVRHSESWDVIRLSNTEAPSEPFLFGSVTLVPGAGTSTNGTAYWVSQAGARKLLQARDKICRPLDFDLRHHWERRLRMASTAKRLFRQRSHEEVASIIGNRSGYRQAPLLDKLVIYGRKHIYHVLFFMACYLHVGRAQIVE